MKLEIKARGIFGISTLFAILTALITVTLYAGNIRTDLDYTTEKAHANEARIEAVLEECTRSKVLLMNALTEEVSNRKNEYTEIQVKLAEIDTHLLYIREAITDKE